MSEPRAIACIPARRLAAFGDRLVLRDPRALSRRPGLRPYPGGLAVHGPFQVRLHGVVDRARGVRFADATGDPNPIHREGEVVPGAYVAARIVSAVEVLLPEARLETLRATFTGVSWYDRSLRITLRCTPLPGDPDAEDPTPRLRVEAVAWQDRREVATARLEGRLAPEVPRVELPLSEVDGQWLVRVVSFFDALGLDAEAWFHKAAGPDLSYPLAFLASLPSGSMVERFQGQGGILNRLSLEFQVTRLPLSGPPEVDLELPARLRRSFNRILTSVKEGVRTAVKGTALVLPRPPEGLLRPDEG